MLTPVESTVFRLDGGREVRWAGMFTGHSVLSERELAGLSQQLLGVDYDRVPDLARDVLVSHPVPAGASAPMLVLHSTSPTLRALEGDATELLAGRTPHDVATYTEARSVYLAGAADLCVGRTKPWREAVDLYGVPAVDVGNTDYYYLAHALLVLAQQYDQDPASHPPAHPPGEPHPLGELVGWLRSRPDAVVRVYALDRETQLLLLWLRQQAGLDTVLVEANSPVVSARWNRKSHIHPSVREVSDLYVGGDVDEILHAEHQHSDAYRRLGLRMPVIPGYLIPRAGASPRGFVDDVLCAAELLRARYAIDVGALKPSEAGDGARIAGHLDLTDQELLAAAAREAYPHGDDYLLEAWVDFLPVTMDGRVQPVVPSGHFRHGRVADGLTLQLLDRYSWRGNVYLDETGWTRLGLPPAAYHAIRGGLEAVWAAFLGPPSVADGSHRGLVVGGIDFAVGRIGGRFGHRTVVGAIDFNLSAHGAEFLRAFLDEAQKLGTGERYGTTQVFVPPARSTLRGLARVAAEHRTRTGLARAISCVPGRWAMVASTGADPGDALRRVRAIVAAATRADRT